MQSLLMEGATKAGEPQRAVEISLGAEFGWRYGVHEHRARVAQVLFEPRGKIVWKNSHVGATVLGFVALQRDQPMSTLVFDGVARAPASKIL